MVHGANKSRSRKRHFVRTTKQTVVRYAEKRPSAPSSPLGKPLAGVARGTKTTLNKLAKTQKRPNRPYGGQLTSAEMRAVLKQQVKLSMDSSQQ